MYVIDPIRIKEKRDKRMKKYEIKYEERNKIEEYKP
jgi:hypothetical protein